MSNEKVTAARENQMDSIAIKMSELLYLCFWGIMLFAKGIGLYDGQNIYKLFLVTAFLCIAVKMCITEYTCREWGLILVLLVLTTIVYRVSGEKGVLICMVTVIAMKNVSVKRAFRVGLVVWSAAMGGRFLLSLIYIENVHTEVQEKNITGAVLRYFMGYPHPNTLHISYLILTAFVIYCVKEKYGFKHLLVLAAGNLFVFFYSYSFTGTLIVMLYVCLTYYVSKRKISRAEYFLVKLFFPFCILFSVIFPLVLRGKAFELADKVFNNRINFARHFLTVDNMSLLGNNLAAITTDIITMDNSFIFALVTYGVPVFVLICAGYLVTVPRYIKQENNIELAVICCFLAAGITEPFLFNTSFKNLTLLFIGEQLFSVLRSKDCTQKKVAIFKNMDRTVIFSAESIQKVLTGWQKLWDSHGTLILGMGSAAAVIISVCTGIIYQDRPAVLELQKDHLLVFERIRIVVTAFVLGFAAAVIIISTALKAADSRRRHDKEK